jgi:Family of unknown function (DUF6600)/FecR protein
MQNSVRPTKALLCAALLVASSAFSEAFAEAFAEASAEASADPPARVARLAFVDGAVSIAPADTDAWSEALVNRPLTSGDRIWVDAGARAELDAGGLTIRLDQNTSFSFVNLTEDVLTARLNEGVIQLHVLRAQRALEVTTPNSVVSVLQPGDYTLQAAGTQTIVKNYDGAVEVSGGNFSYAVGAQEQGTFADLPSFNAEIGAITPRSEFEAWAYARDAAYAAPVASNYVAPDVVGYRDLDSYGTWSATTNYGYVWQPSYVSVGWAPYRYGRWVWVTPWGWTWVDDAPWGFAPFHYGRWVYLRSRWCWAPGPRWAHPVYAPAMVGWIGHPGGPYGNVGWFPLAPRETYLPGYRTSLRYFRNVNIANTTVINASYIDDAYYGRAAPIDYRHRHTPHATTLVPRDAFVSGRPLGNHHAVPDDAGRLIAEGRPPSIAPSRDSRFGVRTDVHPPQFAQSHTRTAASRAHGARAAETRDGVPPRQPLAASASRYPSFAMPQVQRQWSGQRSNGVTSAAALPNSRTPHRATAPRIATTSETVQRARPRAPPSGVVGHAREATALRDGTAPRSVARGNAFGEQQRQRTAPARSGHGDRTAPGRGGDHAARAAGGEPHAGFGVRQPSMPGRSFRR